MLRELLIKNLAIIEHAHLELRNGLVCFTGSTGAGKSLVLGALELLLGTRSAGDMLPNQVDHGMVSGLFELHQPNQIHTIRNLLCMDDEDGDADDTAIDTPWQMLIQRKIYPSGRSAVHINGQPATVAMLASVGEHLIDVHGQHDHQQLLKSHHQRLVLDRFGQCDELRQQYAELHREHRELTDRLNELTTSETLRAQQLELLRFQAEEIDAVEPDASEYEELEARHRVLSNLGKIQSQAHQVHAGLYESDGAIVERLEMVVGILAELGELDEQLEPIATDARAALGQLHDTSFALQRYLNRIELDPQELAEVEDRMNQLNRLIHKYGQASAKHGGSLQDVVQFRQQIQSQIDQLQSDDQDTAALQAKAEQRAQQMVELGGKLTRKRQAAAKKLAKAIEAELAELGMEEAKLHVEVEPREDLDSPHGRDTVQFMIQANPGHEALPLKRVASGGELSRVMLAIKSIVAEADRVNVVVFDEIDANIGGRLGTVIGSKLRALAGEHQVWCITHLPQIAAFADQHWHIEKSVTRGVTQTQVHQIEDDTRIDELAAMLTGKHATDTTRKQARELVDLAQQHRDPEITITPAGRSPNRKTRRRKARTT